MLENRDYMEYGSSCPYSQVMHFMATLYRGFTRHKCVGDGKTAISSTDFHAI